VTRPTLYCNQVRPERMECVWFDSDDKKHTFRYNPKTEYEYWDGQQYVPINKITDPPT